MIQAEVIDPLSFTLEALGSRGALVDPTADGGLAVLPPALARALGTTEELQLVSGAAPPGFIACGFGTPLLDRLIQDARVAVPVVWVRLDARPPAASQAEAIAAKIVLRNGLLDVIDVAVGEELYLSASFSVVAEADDRYETLFQVVLRPDGAGTPDEVLAALLDPRRTVHRLTSIGAEPIADLTPLIPRAHAAADNLLTAFQDAVRRRLDRDRARLEEYFTSLIADARTPRRSVPEAAIAAKLAHLEAERDQKVRDLEPRYAIKATVTPAAFVCARIPAARVRLRARRRKAEGEIIVVVPADVRSPDRLACAACHRTTLRPVACDDRLHLLCEACCPAAQGRPQCRPCRGKR